MRFWVLLATAATTVIGLGCSPEEGGTAIADSAFLPGPADLPVSGGGVGTPGATRASDCPEYLVYRPKVYQFDWFDRDGQYVGQSTGDVFEKIIWRNPADGRLVAIDPEPGEPFQDQSAPTGHYYASTGCQEVDVNRTTYFYEEQLISERMLADSACIQTPFVVGGQLYYGFVKSGESEFAYRSSRVPEVLNPTRECNNWRTDSTVTVAEGRLVEAAIELPPGPFERRPKPNAEGSTQ